MLPHLSELPSWADARRVSIDTETHDEDLRRLGPGWRRGAEIVGISFAIDDGSTSDRAFYLPIGHQGGGNYPDPDQIWAYLRDQAYHFHGDLAGANLSYDLDGLENYGVKFNPRYHRDIMISGPLLDEPALDGIPNPMGLDAQARRLNLHGKDEAELQWFAKEHFGLTKPNAVKGALWRMPAEVVAPYALQDARLPLEILRRHERELEAQGLWELYNMECRLLPILVKMRRRGVKVNLDGLDQIRQKCQVRETELLDEVRRRTGVPIHCGDTMKAALVAKCLEHDGVEVPLTPTGLPSVTAPWLKNVNTEIARMLLRARQVAKIRGTFCKSMFAHETGGRIHCTLNQLKAESADGGIKGAAFGRLSASDPNLQQQPVRDKEFGPLWRGLFEPDEGGEWVCCDYSSQEPRWITAYAEKYALSSKCRWTHSTINAAISAATACRTDPNWCNHSMMAGLVFGNEFSRERYDAGSKEDKRLRDTAKTIFLGLAYGMGGGKLCVSLGLPVEMVFVERFKREIMKAGPEGQELLDRFNQRVPYVRSLAYAVQNRVEENGYVLTAYGRCCRFAKYRGEYEYLHKALNRLIQGSAADQMKLAMIELDRIGIPLQLQVHDEIDFTTHDRSELPQVAEIMSNILPANVPFPVDVEVGPNWGELSAV